MVRNGARKVVDEREVEDRELGEECIREARLISEFDSATSY